jgi:hypothetical protein
MLSSKVIFEYKEIIKAFTAAVDLIYMQSLLLRAMMAIGKAMRNESSEAYAIQQCRRGVKTRKQPYLLALEVTQGLDCLLQV